MQNRGPHRHLVAFLALLSAFLALPTHAGDPLYSDENWVTAAFISAPTTVVVDVVDVSTGTTVGDDLATAQLQIDGADSIYHKFDLSTVTGYPTDCTAKTYLVQFIPDSADCSESGSPGLCAAETVQVGGSACLEGVGHSDTYTHTSTVVSAQGISQTVLNFYNQRGTLPLLWREIDRSTTYNFTTPDSTIWEVYFYTDSAAAPRILCTVETASDPAVSLPSHTHCT